MAVLPVSETLSTPRRKGLKQQRQNVGVWRNGQGGRGTHYTQRAAHGTAGATCAFSSLSPGAREAHRWIAALRALVGFRPRLRLSGLLHPPRLHLRRPPTGTTGSEADFTTSHMVLSSIAADPRRRPRRCAGLAAGDVLMKLADETSSLRGQARPVPPVTIRAAFVKGVAASAGSCVVGLSGVAGVCRSSQLTLSQLAADGRISSSPDTLSSFGFDRAYVCGPDDSACTLALAAARAALVDAALEPGQIDVLIWASARPENHLRTDHAAGAIGGGFMDGFKYASGWLQDTLDLPNAEVMAVAQQGCSTMFAALRVAHALPATDARRRHILCRCRRASAGCLAKSSTTSSAMPRAVVVSRDCQRIDGLPIGTSRAASTGIQPSSRPRSSPRTSPAPKR